MIPIRISFLLLKKLLLLAKQDVLFKPVFFIYTLPNSINNLNILLSLSLIFLYLPHKNFTEILLSSP